MNWKEELLKKYEHMLTKDERYAIRMFGIECGDGWRTILENLFANIQLLIDGGAPMIELHQVKEKFGGLRFYAEECDDNVRKAISDAELAAWNTCELCGSTEEVGCTNGWITVCCRKCHGSNERLQRHEWLSHEERQRRHEERLKIGKG